jgi:AcrR family transcriptional regulator
MPRITAPTLAEHREATWKRLRDAFLADLSEHGYADLSLASVARRAGIARNTIYNYAPDKDALLVAVFQEQAQPFLDSLAQTVSGIEEPEIRLVRATEHVLAAFVPGARGLPIMNTRNDMLPVEVRRALEACMAPAFQLLVDIIEQGVARGIFRPVPDIPRTVERIVAVVETARRHILEGEPLEVISAETTAFLVGALTFTTVRR